MSLLLDNLLAQPLGGTAWAMLFHTCIDSLALLCTCCVLLQVLDAQSFLDLTRDAVQCKSV